MTLTNQRFLKNFCEKTEKSGKSNFSVIRKYPKETYAFKCKLVAQIQLAQYSEALELIRKTPAHQMG